MIIAVAILFGLVVGSFLNVCIVRLPEDESVVSPRSHCRACEAPIAWRDNIPLLGYALLRGRCRSCGARFSARYPLVEALTAALFALVVAKDAPAPEIALDLTMVSLLIVVTFIDIDHFLIFDRITLPTIWLSPIAAYLVGHVRAVDSLIGIAVGGGLLGGFAWLYERARGREGMGFGDVKLLAMIGGVLGWEAALFSLFAAAISGSVIGLALMVARGGRLDMAIPFGPFLAFGGVLYMLAGPALIDLYFSYSLSL